MPSDPRYGKTRYGESAYGGTVPQPSDDFDAPWRINQIRVDGLDAGGDIPPVIPGEEATYRCVFKPDETRTVSAPYRERFRALRSFLPRTPAVVTYEASDGTVYYREQHGGASNLVRIEPLRSGQAAVTADGSDPPTRDSIHDGRWAVITGGSNGSVSWPAAGLALEIETVTIAAAEEFDSADAVAAARERSGL